jgi:hypothetical protein
VKVQVISVETASDGALMATFGSLCATASAHWRSKKFTPHAGEEYDVELDVSVIADRATNTRSVEVASPALFVQGEMVLLRGAVEGVEDDGLVYLRMAPDCLVMVDTAGGISTGDVVQICVPSSALSITPTGV